MDATTQEGIERIEMSDDKQLIDALCSVVGLKDSTRLFERVRELDEIAKETAFSEISDSETVRRLIEWCNNADPGR